MSGLPAPAGPLADGVVALRAWRTSDVPAIAAACADPEIQRFTTVPADYSEADAREYVASREPQRRAGAALGLAIVDATDDRLLLGSIALLRISILDRRGEIGYWLAPEARGRGAATRAVTLLSGWTFATLGFERLEIIPFLGNGPSERVAERAGYDREAVLRSYYMSKDGLRDVAVYSLLASEPSS